MSAYPFENDPEALKTRALELYRDRLCPHCGGKISRWEALSMVFGSTVEYWVRVKHVATGKLLQRRISQVNPQTMAILHLDN
jgi:hypothetical protein